eukprot:1407911-Prymnesium_polylepis.2
MVHNEVECALAIRNACGTSGTIGRERVRQAVGTQIQYSSCGTHWGGGGRKIGVGSSQAHIQQCTAWKSRCTGGVAAWRARRTRRTGTHLRRQRWMGMQKRMLRNQESVLACARFVLSAGVCAWWM